jgi:multidrug efflux pump subunit AcrA (membrane-fusion protein)
MAATVTIRSPVGKEALVVPDQSVIRSGRRNVAIVALGKGHFEPREVEIGASGEGYLQILSGLREGERIVVSSQFLIDSESNLKAAVQSLSAAPVGPASSPGSEAPAEPGPSADPGRPLETEPR